jgi:hypothetical protein
MRTFIDGKLDITIEGEMSDDEHIAFHKRLGEHLKVLENDNVKIILETQIVSEDDLDFDEVMVYKM